MLGLVHALFLLRVEQVGDGVDCPESGTAHVLYLAHVQQNIGGSFIDEFSGLVLKILECTGVEVAFNFQNGDGDISLFLPNQNVHSAHGPTSSTVY